MLGNILSMYLHLFHIYLFVTKAYKKIYMHEHPTPQKKPKTPKKPWKVYINRKSNQLSRETLNVLITKYCVSK